MVGDESQMNATAKKKKKKKKKAVVDEEQTEHVDQEALAKIKQEEDMLK